MLYNNELKLRECLNKFLGLLDSNLIRAEKDWKDQIISKSAFEYIRQRQVVAHVIPKRPDIQGEEFYDICAPITIDLEVAIKDLEDPTSYEILLLEWFECFDNIGFTDRQPVFNYPMKNLNDFDKKNKDSK